jgi:hypothetical protein
LTRAIYPFPGTSTFDMAMGILKSLQQDYGAVVTEVDVVPDGLRVDLRLPAEDRSLQVRARRQVLESTRRQVNERLEYCRQVREALRQQYAELGRQRLWLASVKG